MKAVPPIILLPNQACISGFTRTNTTWCDELRNL